MNYNPLQKVGRVTAWGMGCLEVFWNPDTRTISLRELGRKSFFLLDGEKAWGDTDQDVVHEISDGNIINSIAGFLPCSPHQIYADKITVFGQSGTSKEVNEQLKLNIYDCDWSDFACEKQVIEFNVRNFGWLSDKYERLATAIEENKWVPGAELDQEAINRTAAELRPLYIRTPPESDDEPQEPCSPTCGYCSGEGELYFAKDENIRCRDCFGLAVDTHYMERADNEAGYCAC